MSEELEQKVQIDGKEYSVLIVEEDQEAEGVLLEKGEYLFSMKETQKYLNLSKHQMEKEIVGRAARGELKRFQFLGRTRYARQSDLDRLRSEIFKIKTAPAPKDPSRKERA